MGWRLLMWSTARTSAASPKRTSQGGAPAPRRRDARRQPPLGARPRGGRRGAPGRRRQDRGAARSWCVTRASRYVTLWLLSTDNLDRAGGARPALRSSRRPSRTSPRRHWQLNIDRCARPAARPDDRRGSGTRRSAPATSTGMTVNVAVGYGGRREIADAVRDLLLEPRGRGASHRGGRRRPRRRAHRRAPLHPGPARPRPRHPHVRRAAAGRLPALAERALGVLLLRRVLAGLPPRRLPAGPQGVCRPAPSLRRLSGSWPGGPASGRA